MHAPKNPRIYNLASYDQIAERHHAAARSRIEQIEVRKEELGQQRLTPIEIQHLLIEEFPEEDHSVEAIERDYWEIPKARFKLVKLFLNVVLMVMAVSAYILIRINAGLGILLVATSAAIVFNAFPFLKIAYRYFWKLVQTTSPKGTWPGDVPIDQAGLDKYLGKFKEAIAKNALPKQFAIVSGILDAILFLYIMFPATLGLSILLRYPTSRTAKFILNTITMYWDVLIVLVTLSALQSGRSIFAFIVILLFIYFHIYGISRLFFPPYYGKDAGVIRLLTEKNMSISFILYGGFMTLCGFGLLHYRTSILDYESYSRRLSVLDSLYFSVVTVTTVGYGDIYPVSIYSKLLTMTEMVVGYLFSGVVLATILTVWQKNLLAKEAHRETDAIPKDQPIKKVEAEANHDADSAMSPYDFL